MAVDVQQLSFCPLACMQLPLVVLALTSSYTFDLLHV